MQKLIERYRRQKAKYEAELNGLLQQIMKALPNATNEEKEALEELGVKLPAIKTQEREKEPVKKNASR